MMSPETMGIVCSLSVLKKGYPATTGQHELYLGPNP